jgi:hypothetical protein
MVDSLMSSFSRGFGISADSSHHETHASAMIGSQLSITKKEWFPPA